MRLIAGKTAMRLIAGIFFAINCKTALLSYDMQKNKILTEKLINFRAASRHFVLKTFTVYIYSYWHFANKNNRLIQLFFIHQQFRSCIVLYNNNHHHQSVFQPC